MVERQREWPLEAGARVALVVHALPPAVPRRSQRWFWPWGRGQCNRITCDAPPNSRTGQVRASVHPPAPRRPGRNRTVSPIEHNAPHSQGPRGGRNRSVAGRRSLPHPHGQGPRLWRRCLRLLRWRGQHFGRNDCLQSQQQISSSPIRSLPDAAGDVSCLSSQGAGQPNN